MASFQSDNLESSPESDEDGIKVVVIGEPRCGKTRFIRAYYDHHLRSAIIVQSGVKVYQCEFEGNNEMRRASIYEIPGYSYFPPELRTHHYKRADILIFMFAIDDPSSFQKLTEKWIEEAMDIIISRNIPIMFIGTKLDLRDDQQVIERLALENQSPVTFEKASELLHSVPHDATLMECSANDADVVEGIFNTMFGIFLDNE